MARLIQGIVAKYRLSTQPMIVQIENGGGGGQGFMDIKNSEGDANKIAIVLSNLYSVPLSTNLPFNWRDTTPVAMMALDGGRIALGTWQSICLVDPNGDNPNRQVRFSFISD